MEIENEVFLAKLAKKAGRFDDVVESMKKVCSYDADLLPEQRDLLSTGYEEIVKAHRASLDVIRGIEREELEKGETKNLGLIREYRQKVEAQLEKICNEFLSLLETDLIHASTNADDCVFYNTMRGNYYRYLAEIKDGDEKQKFVVKSREAYEWTQKLAADLDATHPTRLRAALDFSVFLHDSCHDIEEAYKVAKDAYGLIPLSTKLGIIGRSSEVTEDSILIRQLADNLNQWHAEVMKNRSSIARSETQRDAARG